MHGKLGFGKQAAAAQPAHGCDACLLTVDAVLCPQNCRSAPTAWAMSMGAGAGCQPLASLPACTCGPHAWLLPSASSDHVIIAGAIGSPRHGESTTLTTRCSALPFRRYSRWVLAWASTWPLWV